MGERNADIVIVGGGVIGVCVAYFAAYEGASVIVIERDRIPCGSSYGNAGLLVTSHYQPLPSPRIIAEGMRELFKPSGAFSILPRADLGLMSWFWKFYRSCSEKHLLHAMSVFRQLGQESFLLHCDLAERGGSHYEYEQRGVLSLYTTFKGFEEARKGADLMKKYGVQWIALSSQEVQQRDPSIRTQVAGGILHPRDGRLQPAAFVEWLAGEARSRGVQFSTDTEVFGFGKTQRRVDKVHTTRGDIQGDQVVLAAGAWTSSLSRKLGVRLPIEGGKGYSFTFERPQTSPQYPLLLEELRVALTPFNGTFRATGVLELSGLNLTIDERRLRGIQQQASIFMPELRDMKLLEIWRGLRPCTPDGLPILGRLHPWNNVWVASGHATKGMSLGPATGKWMSDLLSGKSLGSVERSLAANRFSRF
jgi:D-amino-acid dehydrogenase